MVDSINQYIRYHSEPCSGFVSIKEWNNHFGTNMEENEELEYKIMQLRSQLGHNEFIPTRSLLRYIRKSATKSVKSAIDNKTAVYKRGYMRHAAGKLAGALHLNRIRKITNKLRGKKKEKEEPTEVEQEDAQEEKKEEEEEVEDLDDLLQAEPEYEEEDMDDILAEQEYEETATYAEKKKCGPKKILRDGKCVPRSRKKKLQEEYEEEDMDDILAEQEYEEMGKKSAKEKNIDRLIESGKAGKRLTKRYKRHKKKQDQLDLDKFQEDDDASDDGGFQQAVDELEISDAQALNHLVAFKGKFDDIRTRVMKGKARYIEKLQAYLDGDENAEVRMYNGTKLRIANLKPNRESLSKALQAFPSGPHFIECD